MIKPRIKFDFLVGMWSCGYITAYARAWGRSPLEAYNNWMSYGSELS